MPSGRKARDLELLDALEACDGVAFEGTVWRAVREGRDPILGHPSGGRWDPGLFDVVYTALDRDGAIAETSFHLSRQPVFPSKLRFAVYELRVRVTRILRFEKEEALVPLGVDVARYREVLYSRTQAIGDAADFLGFDGIIAPSARWPCLNLALFTAGIAPEDIAIQGVEPVDVLKWRSTMGRPRRKR